MGAGLSNGIMEFIETADHTDAAVLVEGAPLALWTHSGVGASLLLWGAGIVFPLREEAAVLIRNVTVRPQVGITPAFFAHRH